MPRFEPLEEFLDESLTLPIAGADGTVRDYVIQPSDGARWLRIMTLQQVSSDGAAGTKSAPGDVVAVLEMSQRSILDDTLGADVAQAMLDDGVPGAMIRRAGAAAVRFHLDGVDAARAAWSGKAASPRTRSGKTGGAAHATKRASTSGTNTRRKSPKR